MAIKINTGFSLGAALPLDDRAYLTKAQMLTINENIYPDYFLAVCADDGGVYVYNKALEGDDISAETGKFVLLAGSAEEAIRILNSDENTENSVRYWIKNLASKALYDPAEKKFYTFTSGDVSIKISETEKAALDLGNEIEVNETTKLIKTADGYAFKVGETETAVAPVETEEVSTTTIKEAIEALANAAEVKLEPYTEEGKVTPGFLKTYELFQGEKSLGKIDIPKDLVVTEGSVIEVKEVEKTTEEEVQKYQVGDETYTEADTEDEESKWYGYPAAAGTFIKLVVANQLKPIFINAEDLVDTGSLGKVTKDITANVAVGGIEIGDKVVEGTDITELVEQLIVKYYAPEIKLDGSVTNKVQRVGTILSDTVLTATFTKKSLDITSVTVDGETTTEGVAEGGEITKTIAEIADTTEFVATATDGKKEVTAKVKYEFVLPYMHGVSDKNTIETDADLEALTEVVEKKGTKTFSYTADNQYCVFIMPAEYDDLKSILDPSKFENLSSWTKSTYTNAAGEAYKIYITNTKVTCTAFKYTFS